MDGTRPPCRSAPTSTCLERSGSAARLRAWTSCGERRGAGASCTTAMSPTPLVAPEAGRSVLEIYRWVAAGLIAGLRLLGIEASVAEHPRGDGPATERPMDCFAVATGADLDVEGRKICGSAQVRRKGWFLQHGSLPIVDIRAKTASLLGDSVDRRSTCLQRLRPGTTWNEAASALIAGFAAAWGVEPRRRRPERSEWGSNGEVPQYWGVPEGPRAAAVLQDPRGMV